MPSTVAALAVAKHQRELIIKPLEYHVLAAPMTAAPILNITAGASSALAELPTGAGWFDHGLIDKEQALTWSREMERAVVMAAGYRDPVRTDITQDMTSLAFTALETNRHNLELRDNVDLSGPIANATTSEVAYNQPPNARPLRRRYLAIARDGQDVDTIYIARHLVCGEVTEVGDQTWTDADGIVAYPTTLSAQVDTTVGFSVRHFFGGPGWASLLDEAGFTKAA